MNADENLNRQTCTQRVYDYLTLGYKVIIMNECEWLKLKQSVEVSNTLKHWAIPKPNYNQTPFTEMAILQTIMTRNIVGLVQVDIVTPETLKEYFKEMTPIFKNVDVAVKDCGLYMAKFVKEHKVTKPT